MNEIFDFAKNATPMILLALALVIIVLLVLGNDTILNVFKRQKLNTYKIESGKATLDSVAKQLDVITGNHLHELPDIKKAVDRIEQEQVKQGNRLTSVETTIKILLKT